MNIKRIIAVICAAAAITASVQVLAWHEDKDNGKIDVNLNGTYLDFDVDPIMQNDRVMLPMRKIFESLGASVEWDDSTKTAMAQKDGKAIELTVGSSEMLVNGEGIALDAPAVIVDGRTLVPVRAVSEALGASVAWCGHGEDIVTISTYDITCEDAIQITRDIYKGYGLTDGEVNALNLEIGDMREDIYDEPHYDVIVNWHWDEDDECIRYSQAYVGAVTGKMLGGAG